MRILLLQKKVIEGVCFIDMNDPCEFLDPETKKCMVFESRFKMCPDCRKMTVLHPFFCSYLPDTCGYVEFFRKWGWLKMIKSRLRKGQK